jgi:hypothetical protein
LRRAAAGTAALRIEYQLGLREGDARFGEDRLPGLVERGERVARFAADGIDRAAFARRSAALRLRRRRLRLLLLCLLQPADQLGGIDAEHERGDQRDHQGAAADAATAHPGRTPAAALVFDVDVARIEIVEPHPLSSPCRAALARIVPQVRSYT